MAKSKAKVISVKTANALLDELNLAFKNKSRTIDSIQNKEVKKLIKDCGKQSISKTGVIVGATSAGIAVSIGAGTGVGVLGAGAGAGAGAATVAKFTAIGASAGSVAPGVGTAIGAAGGAIVGIAATALIMTGVHKKKKNRTEALQKETLAKMANSLQLLKAELKDLEREIDKLKAENKNYESQLKRYEYLVGIITTSQALLSN